MLCSTSMAALILLIKYSWALFAKKNTKKKVKNYFNF